VAGGGAAPLLCLLPGARAAVLDIHKVGGPPRRRGHPGSGGGAGGLGQRASVFGGERHRYPYA